VLLIPRSTRAAATLLAFALAFACLAGACSPANGGPGDPAGSAGSAGAAGTSLGWSDALTGGPEKLDVATTVAPISSIARNIGGDRIRLRGLIPDGTNSHTFEPAPSDAQTLANADLIVVNGLHLEQPTVELADASKRPDTPIRQLADETITKDQWLFDFSFPASAGDPNPHLWMDVQYAIRYAELLRDWFSQADPPNAATYAANFTAY
jgi:ABC-type Zn uptake system ZnuABC Zn-binding protein ZnuA